MRQFLDLGSGIPTLGNVHEVAQKAASESRIVYVDIDPVAVAHSRHVLSGNDNAAVIREDLRNVEQILADPQVKAMLDVDRPVAVLMLAVLHFVADGDDPPGIVARFRDALAPGSYLALSHGTQDGTRRDGFGLVDPGVVWSVEWRPEHPDEVGESPERCAAYVGVGHKR